jgi:hypothetical protein
MICSGPNELTIFQPDVLTASTRPGNELNHSDWYDLLYPPSLWPPRAIGQTTMPAVKSLIAPSREQVYCAPLSSQEKPIHMVATDASQH